MGSNPVFTGTRVPVQSLLEFLEAGDTIDDFLAAFPSVKRAQAVGFLRRTADLAVAAAARFTVVQWIDGRTGGDNR